MAKSGSAASHADPDDDELVEEARKRFKRVEEWESVARGRYVDDIKFCNADAYNMYQWPLGARTARGYGEESERPCLTVNKTAQHCLQIVNDGRQNKTSAKIKPMGDQATYEAAQVLEGIVRHIEYISDAQTQYSTARRFMVQGGMGYLRVKTDYCDDLSFDQDARIEAIHDPLSVYIDPDATQPDGSDMRFAFVFTDMPRDQFENEYPEYKDRMPPAAALGNQGDNSAQGWITEKHVRIAEYFYRNEVRDTLIVFVDPITGEKRPIKKSETAGWSGELRAALNEQLKDPATKTREIIGHEVKWIKIIGDEIGDRGDWDGSTIPIIPMFGMVTVIDGELDRKGHTRAMIDSQRMLNYNASAAIEYGALQSKAPWIAAREAIEGDENWENANLINPAVLTFNHKDDDGNPIPTPVKTPPPMGAPLYQEGMKNASDDMMMVSGQYQPMMGEPSNERSGKAIQARQRQGENATYHFVDHEARAIRRIAAIIIDLAPHIYDTPRTMMIIGEDGSESEIQIDPDAQAAYERRKKETEDAAEQVIMNPKVGRYEVLADVGPDYATRRQEAFNALSQIAAQNPELMAIIGDLVMLAADFPLADEAAERLKRMVPPQALGEGVPPAVQHMQQQLQSTQALIASMSQKLVELQSKLASKDAQKSVDIYKAITDRLDVLLDKTHVSPTDILRFQHDLAMQEHAGNLDLAGRAVDAALQPDATQTDSTGMA